MNRKLHHASVERPRLLLWIRHFAGPLSYFGATTAPTSGSKPAESGKIGEIKFDRIVAKIVANKQDHALGLFAIMIYQ